MTKKRILITGGTGFIGANLVRKFIELNYDTHILTRKTSNKWRIIDVLDRLNEHQIDLGDREGLKKVVSKIKPEIIVHTAVYGGYPSEQDGERMIKTNFIDTVNLVDACSDIDYELFISTGTSSEYGTKDTKMKETDLLEPITFYGVSKASATLYYNYIAKTKKKPITTLRLFSPFGYYEDKHRLIPYVIINCLKNSELNLGDKNSVRDFVFIEDVISSYITTVENKEKITGEIFNIGSGRQYSIGEVVDTIIQLTGGKGHTLWGSIVNPRSEPKVWQADISKAKELLGWQPAYDLNRGLEKTLEWFKGNITLYKKI